MPISNFKKLVHLFIDSNEIGHYDPDNFSICLYGVNIKDKSYIENLKKRIETITTKYRLAILKEDAPGKGNINILDIDL